MGGLAGECWRQTLNARNPTSEGIMGERVARYRARYATENVKRAQSLSAADKPVIR
jgi:hypothetical protein